MDNKADLNMKGNRSFGMAVSGIGDINGDGYDDVIVGEYISNSVYLFFGGMSMDSVPDLTLNADNRFGYSVSGAGDVNNDGYADIIVGAYQEANYTGAAYIYYGGVIMDTCADIVLFGEGESNYFGYSVSGAGDVNNDGYDDVIVGANKYSSDSGRAYIYLGGTNMDDSVDIIITGETNSQLGCSVSNAGDVNNDGFDDVIIGAYHKATYTGCAYVYFGGDVMDNSADVNLTGDQEYSCFGYSVSGAGDVNNDGHDDVIIGAYHRATYTGCAYVYFGGDVMDNIADITQTGTGEVSLFGYSVSGAGDVDNDGYDDVIVGAQNDNNGTGRVYLNLGGSDSDSLADIIIVEAMGSTEGNNFGFSVSTAGDVNNDGYDDVIVGAYGNNDYIGKAYIYFGSSAEAADNTADVVLSGEGYGDDFFGYAVSAAGDVNNDGYDDVIIGAYRYASSMGRAYLFFGGTTINSNADLILSGVQEYDCFGWSVSTAGDFNNDGYCDVVVSAIGNSSETGRVYIYFGSSSMDEIADIILIGEEEYSCFGCSVSGAGDVNNDSFDDVIVGSDYFNSETGRVYIIMGGCDINTINKVILNGEKSGINFGCSVSGAGDVNNDSFDDVIVGASGYDQNSGRTYIYYGGNNMDTLSDAYFNGCNERDQFGYSVSGAGDVNDDGFSDIIVGAYKDNGTGKAYVYYGGTSMDTVADIVLFGYDESSRFGYSVSRGGDINNDGYDDVIIGAYQYSYNGKAYIYTFDSTFQKIKIPSAKGATGFGLLNPYPNPFNPNVILQYSLIRSNRTSLKIYNLLGQEVATLVDSYQNKGAYSLNWQPQNLSAGIYLVRLESGNQTSLHKVVFMK